VIVLLSGIIFKIDSVFTVAQTWLIFIDLSFYFAEKYEYSVPLRTTLWRVHVIAVAGEKQQCILCSFHIILQIALFSKKLVNVICMF